MIATGRNHAGARLGVMESSCDWGRFVSRLPLEAFGRNDTGGGHVTVKEELPATRGWETLPACLQA
jgi:hypothetical protein